MTPLDYARSQLGVREATGRNDGVPAERYNHGEAKAWCATFVAWCFAQAGCPLPGNQYRLASVQCMEDELRDVGLCWPRETFLPDAGDIVFFDSRGQSDRGTGRHVGIVELVTTRRSGSTLWTIEGNSSNAVRRRQYNASDKYVTGYARWGRQWGDMK